MDKLVATPTWSSTFGYQHYWTKIVRSTVSYGYLRINNTAADPGTNYHVSNYASGNIIIQPSALYLFGAEYIYASLRRKDDFKWVAPRFQASVHVLPKQAAGAVKARAMLRMELQAAGSEAH